MKAAPTTVDGPSCIELAKELISIPSPSGQEQAVAEFIAQRLSEAGVEVQEIPHGNVLARVDGHRPGPVRLFLTHTDTMSADGMTDPYAAKIVDGASYGIEGDALVGLGAAAPKGAVAAMIIALEAVAADREGLDGSVYLGIATKDLLANHEGAREILDAAAINADWVVAGEPSGNRVVLGARGIAQVDVDVEGKAAHWGRPDDAANPLHPIADIISTIRATELPHHPDLGYATCVPFDIDTQFHPPHSPHRAVLRLDRRLLPGESAQAVIADLAAVAEQQCGSTPGTRCVVEPRRMMHPFEIDPRAELVQTISRSIEEVTGDLPATMYITFSSNAGLTTAEHGWPSLAFGPGEITALGSREAVAVQELTTAARCFASMMST